MAGKKNREKWKDINHRQRKVAEQARALLKMAPLPKIGMGAVHVGLAPIMKNYVMRKKMWGLIDLKNAFIPRKKAEVAIAANDIVPIQKGGPFSSAEAFKARLEKRGYKFLGSGNFSMVYAKENSTKVLKITHNLSDSWFYYAKWANTNGWGGKYAPKMYSHKFFEQGKFAVAVMERLQPREYSGKEPHTIVEVLTRYSGNPTAERFLEQIEPDLPKFIKDAKARFRFDDDHGQNLMVRTDGTLVWNDPVAWGAKATANDNIKTRLRAKDLAPVVLAA